MNVVFFTLYIILIILIIEISTMLLQMTGLRREVARFQAISLLTNTGYTTSESEMIIGHPVRRRIASFLIIFGTISLTIIVSFMISFLVSSAVHLSDLGIGLAILVGALFLLRSNFFHSLLHRQVGGRFDRYYVHHKSIEEVFHVDHEYVMRQFDVTEGHHHMTNVPLKELNLAQQDVKIMNIRRNQHIIKNPTGSTMLLPGDKVLVYGSADMIRKFFILSSARLPEDER